MRITKAKTSLRITAVWSAPLLHVVDFWKVPWLKPDVLQQTGYLVVNPIARRWVGLQTIWRFRLKGLSADEMVGVWCFSCCQAHTGVCLLDFFCTGIQFYVLLSPYLCFISFLYLDLYVLEMMQGYVGGLSSKRINYVSWSTFELRLTFAPWNRFKPSSKIVLLTVRRRYFFCGSLVLFMSRAFHAFASVHCCLVANCWERADLLALVCVV